VLALPDYSKAGLLEGAHRSQMIDARDPCHYYTKTSTSRTSAPRN
jgi:hypothetical protein